MGDTECFNMCIQYHRYQKITVSPFRCHVSHVTCHLSHVTNANRNSHRLPQLAQQAGLPRQNKHYLNVTKKSFKGSKNKTAFQLANITNILFDQRSPVHREAEFLETQKMFEIFQTKRVSCFCNFSNTLFNQKLSVILVRIATEGRGQHIHNTSTDITPYRLNRARGRCSENYGLIWD